MSYVPPINVDPLGGVDDWISGTMKTGLGAAGAGAAGAGALSMSALLGPLALAFAPMLLGGLFRGGDPARERQRQLERIWSAANHERLAGEGRTNLYNSPGYALASRGITAGSMASKMAMGRAVARAGLGGSRLGMVLPGLALQGHSQGQGQLHSRVWDIADRTATQTQQGMAGSLQGTPMPQNYTANLFGAGMNAFGPLAMDYFRAKYKWPGVANVA